MRPIFSIPQLNSACCQFEGKRLRCMRAVAFFLLYSVYLFALITVSEYTVVCTIFFTNFRMSHIQIAHGVASMCCECVCVFMGVVVFSSYFISLVAVCVFYSNTCSFFRKNKKCTTRHLAHTTYEPNRTAITATAIATTAPATVIHICAQNTVLKLL